jgi:hypothetical protein
MEGPYNKRRWIMEISMENLRNKLWKDSRIKEGGLWRFPWRSSEINYGRTLE